MPTSNNHRCPGAEVAGRPPFSPAAAPLPLPEFARRVAVAVLITVVILIAVGILWLGVRVVMEAFVGIIVGVFLNTLSTWVSRAMRLGYGWALALVVGALFLIAGGVGWLLASRLSAESAEFMQNISKALRQVHDLLSETAWGSY